MKRTGTLWFAVAALGLLALGCSKEPVDPSTKDPSPAELAAKAKRGGSIQAAPAAVQKAPAAPVAQ